jgi:hypothetical protein
MFMARSLVKSGAAEVAPALLGDVPLAYLYGAFGKGSGEDSAKSESFVAKHPLLAASILIGLARLGVGSLKGGLAKG